MAVGLRLALDTNAYSALQRGGSPSLSRLITKAEMIALPFIVIGELRAGFAYGSRQLDNDTKLAKFTVNPRVSACYADDHTANLYARLWADLRRQGTPIPTNDIWIAALCIQNDCVLATNDTDFQHPIALLQTVSF